MLYGPSYWPDMLEKLSVSILYFILRRKMYSRIIFIKSPSYGTKTFNASNPNLTFLLLVTWLQLVHKQTNTGTPWLQLQKHSHPHAQDSVYLPTCDISLGSLMLPAPKARNSVELILLYPFPLYVNTTSKKFSLAQVSLLFTASSYLPNSSSIYGYIADSKHWCYIQCLEKINWHILR